MSFICAAMSGVGDIVQAKRERERLRPGQSQNSPAAAASRRRGHEKLGWAPTLSGACQESGAGDKE